jgi:hypothetical protein
MCEEEDVTASVLSQAKQAVRDKAIYAEWQKRFRYFSEDRLREIIDAEDDSSAIAAAWELYVRRLAYANEARHPKAAGTITNFGARKFVAICEDRLGVRFPAWYMEILRTGDFHESQGVPYATFRGPVETPVTALSQGAVTTQKERVAISEGHVILQGDMARLRLTPSQLVPRHLVPGFTDPVAADGPPITGKTVIPQTGGGERTSIAFASKGDRFWLIAHDAEIATDFPICCYDSAGRPLWSQRVWTTISDRSYSGYDFYHLAVVMLRGEMVYVVGIGGMDAQIEGFDANTGQVTTRFVSTVMP